MFARSVPGRLLDLRLVVGVPLPLVAFLVVGACTSPFPITRSEGTTTTYANKVAKVQVLPPRAARAQKVVLDDPAVLAIQERDTPFRQFFSARSGDFSDVDYAKVTILTDVLNRLRNRSYVRNMLLTVLKKHEAAIDTSWGDAEHQRELRARRLDTLASALDRTFSDLGYPYVDDRDIDRTLQRVTGFEDGVFDASTILRSWPYAEASETWMALVYDDGGPRWLRCLRNGPPDAVKDLVRDLHGALHDRAFFEQVIHDACEHREDLFKNTGAQAPTLSRATTTLREWATRKLDARTRASLVAGRDSLWIAFLTGENQEVEKRTPKRTLDVPIEDLASFAKALRAKVLAVATENVTLTEALRNVLATETTFRAKLAKAGDAQAATKPLLDAATADAATRRAFAAVESRFQDEILPLRTRRDTAATNLPPPRGKAQKTEKMLLDVVREDLDLLILTLRDLHTDAWKVDLADPGLLTEIAEAIAGSEAATAAGLRTARVAEIAALENLVNSGEWRRVHAAVTSGGSEDEVRRRVAISLAGITDIFTRAKNPLQTLIAKMALTATALQDAVAKLPDDRVDLRERAAKAEADRTRRGHLFDRLEAHSSKVSADCKALATLDHDTVIYDNAKSELAAQSDALTQSVTALQDAAFAAMRNANEKLASGNRQDLDGLRTNAQPRVQTWTKALVDSGTPPTLAELLQLLLSDPQLQTQPAADAIVERFEALFGTSRPLFSSDEPVLATIVKHVDLGAGVPELRQQLIARLPAAFTQLVADKEVAGKLAADKDPDGVELAARFEALLATPALNYLFTRPGSQSRLVAFQSEFYQAFRHRLQEAVAAERDVDYDYWWLTFYPKAIPLNRATFDGASLLEIDFPERAIAQEDYARWLQDARSVLPNPRKKNRTQELQAKARLDAVTTVLTSLLRALDSEGLAGKHDGARLATLQALAHLRDHVAPTPRYPDEPEPDPDGREFETVTRNIVTSIAGHLHNLKDPVSRCRFEKQLDLLEKRQQPKEESDWRRSLPMWYRRLLLTDSQADIDDAISLGRHLLTAVQAVDANRTSTTSDPVAARNDTRNGAARALAKAPFGFEHILYATAAAYDGAALLPEIVDLVTNAFFDGVDRFHLEASKFRGKSDAADPGTAADRLMDFLVLSETRVREMPTEIEKQDDFVRGKIKATLEALPRPAAAANGGERATLADPGAESNRFLAAPTTTTLPNIFSDKRQAMSPIDYALHRLALRGPDANLAPLLDYRNKRNHYLEHAELWCWEHRLALTEANLRRVIVHMFRGRYPGSPSAREIQHEVSRDNQHIEALLYRRLRDVWLRHHLVASNSGDTDLPVGARDALRSDLFDVLSADGLLPPGMARDLIGQIETPNGRETSTGEGAPPSPSRFQSIYSWIWTIMGSPTAVTHLRNHLVAKSYPGLWSALGVLCETRMNDVPFDEVSADHYRRFARTAKPALQPGVQILEMLPASRDDLVAMSINEGGAIFQAAARAEAAAAYDVNHYALAADLVKKAAKSETQETPAAPTDPAAQSTTTEEQSMLDELVKERNGAEELGYSARATGKASFYGRARAAMAYAKRREYLDAAITAAGRGDRIAKWVIRPSDLRSDLVDKEKVTIAASHTGYPNGDQPFHLLVKIPHDATQQDWAGRDYVLFNSSYVATQHRSLTTGWGQYGYVLTGLMALIYYPWIDATQERPFGAKFPFQWDVVDKDEQEELFRTPNLLGGRIDLDSTDKIKFSEVKKLLDAEAGFIRATRSAQSARLGEVLGELEKENAQIDAQVREELQARRDASRPKTEATPSGSSGN